MTISVLTLFPDFMEEFFQHSLLARSVEKGLLDYTIVNIRDFAFDNHRSCDDAPFGGGAGMVLKPEPVSRALESLPKGGRVIYPSPVGKSFDEKKAKSLSRDESLVFICGRYEGIDQRVIDLYVDEEISIGDYVLSSGDIAAFAIIDAVFRLLPGVIRGESLDDESFEDGLLEYPHFTRPAVFKEKEVPPVLLSGHHEKIRLWRLRERLRRTQNIRPDLLENRVFTDEEKKLLEELRSE